MASPLNLSPRPLPEQAPPVTEEEVKMMRRGVRYVTTPPVFYSMDESLQRKIHRTYAKRFEGFTDWVEALRWEWASRSETSHDRNGEVIWALQKRTICQLAKLSHELFEELAGCGRQLAQSVLSEKDRAIGLNWTLATLKEHQEVSQKYIPKFTGIWKSYLETLDTLQNRPSSQSFSGRLLRAISPTEEESHLASIQHVYENL